MKPLHPLFAEAPVGPGHRLPMTLLHLRVRDLFLQLAAEAYCGGMTNSAAAEWVHRKISRYRECAWQRDRVAETVPPRLVGHVNALLWCVLKCRDRVPSARLIRLVLSRPSQVYSLPTRPDPLDHHRDDGARQHD